MKVKAKKSKGAKARLREYFLNNVGVIFTSVELFDVSAGKTEWGRRVRELRNQEGMNIVTHNDRSDLKPGGIHTFEYQAIAFFR